MLPDVVSRETGLATEKGRAKQNIKLACDSAGECILVGGHRKSHDTNKTEQGKVPVKTLKVGQSLCGLI